MAGAQYAAQTPPSRPTSHVRPPDVTASQRMLSASIGALITAMTTMPLDVIKTRQQSHMSAAVSPGFTPAAQCCPFYPTCARASPAYLRAVCVHAKQQSVVAARGGGMPSSAAIAGSILRQDGLVGFYRGLTPSLLMAAPSTTIYFTAYDEMKRRLERSTRGSAWATAGVPLVAGILGRVVTVLVISPLELLRTRAMNRTDAGGMLATVRSEIAAGGVRSLWRGLVPTLWRDVPFSGVYWLGYERIKADLTRRWLGDAVQDPTFAHASLWQASSISFAAGATSGAFAATITTPFDVIKTRRQVQQYAATSEKGGVHGSSSTLEVFRHIARQEGLAGLFAGLSTRVAKVAPSCAIMIASYELGKRFFSQLDEQAMSTMVQSAEV